MKNIVCLLAFVFFVETNGFEMKSAFFTYTSSFIQTGASIIQTPARNKIYCSITCVSKDKCGAFQYEGGSCHLFDGDKVNVSRAQDDLVCLPPTNLYVVLAGTSYVAPSTAKRDCKELYDDGETVDGVYTININGKDTKVQCDMTAGGWTVIQRRVSDSVNFRRAWQCYKEGFGDVNTNYWLGMENIRALIQGYSYKLHVDLWSFADEKRTATYSNFDLGDEASNYLLTLTGYSGNMGGDSFGSYSNGYMFSTYDRDNDIHSFNCADRYTGAWWYRGCAQANLNGVYKSSGYVGDDSIHWIHWTGSRTALKKSEIKIKI